MDNSQKNREELLEQKKALGSQMEELKAQHEALKKAYPLQDIEGLEREISKIKANINRQNQNFERYYDRNYGNYKPQNLEEKLVESLKRVIITTDLQQRKARFFDNPRTEILLSSIDRLEKSLHEKVAQIPEMERLNLERSQVLNPLQDKIYEIKVQIERVNDKLRFNAGNSQIEAPSKTRSGSLEAGVLHTIQNQQQERPRNI